LYSKVTQARLPDLSTPTPPAGAKAPGGVRQQILKKIRLIMLIYR